MPGQTLNLEHALAGRARLRLPRPRTQDDVLAAASRVRSAQQVHHVEANPATGSIVIQYDSADPIDDILEELRGLGLEIMVSSAVSELSELQRSQGAKVVENVLGRANAQLQKITDGKADLRLVVPAAFAVLAARQFLKDTGRMRNASWYQLAYWAFDSFHKLHNGRDAR